MDRTTRRGWRDRCAVAMVIVFVPLSGAKAGEAAGLSSIPSRHVHMRALVENALGYVQPGQGLFDPASGYPCEGWNDDPVTGLHLRDFTQLTAIGAWMELLAQMAAGAVPALPVEGRAPASPGERTSDAQDQGANSLEGRAPASPREGTGDVQDQGAHSLEGRTPASPGEGTGDVQDKGANSLEGRAPASPRDTGLEGERPREPLRELEHVVDSLLADQQDPRLAMHGLLCNFMGFESERRVGPLASEAFRKDFLAEFGPDTGEAIWQALKARGWVRAWQDDQAGEIKREDRYGKKGFDGPLEPYAAPAVRDRILAILDRRTIQLIFGDNANLAASVAKTAGALLAPTMRDQPDAIRIRGKLEQFLEAQRSGYAFLYDPQRGLFRFGWNAENRRFVGWGDGQGAWQVGYADYLVNEFRGPTEFVTLRYGFPTDAVRNLGFRIRSRHAGGGRERFTLASWEGSAFQSWGLSLFMDELASPGWRAVLENAVRIHLGYSRQYGLPGFLSESYSGDGIEYTGRLGIPELAVAGDPPRITNAPSLYTLGVAHEILPREVERFLGERWPEITMLMTSHGPWEGMRMPERQPIECQTTAHVLSLILGGVGQSPAAMARYMEARGLRSELARLRPQGERVDFLGADAKAATWSAQGVGVWGQRTWRGYRVSGTEGRQGAVTWTFPARGGEVSLSNGELALGYRNLGPGMRAVLRFEGETVDGQRYGNEAALRFRPAPRSGTLRIPLPATPALTGLRQVVLSFEPEGGGRPDLILTTFRFTPWAARRGE